ncbi:MAG: phosphatase PAP2 family protein [Bacteroidetes bacterium]|jgi:membrane-associated phospholipid phosphatase|nr:phosphatase PAP2 family protein [Bacteroidota bacterium]
MRKNALSLLLLLSFQFCYSQNSDSLLVAGKDYVKENVLARSRFSYKKIYVPTSLIVAGLILNDNRPESIKNEIVEERNKYLPYFKTHVDDYLQYSPIAVAYGLDAFGIKSKTDLTNRTVILLKGELCMLAITQVLKRTTHNLRPDQSSYSSFPSGHTAQAFAAATFLSEEYKDQFKWMPYASYGVASCVGVLRMANNKHFISDVLVGAGIGILSMKVAYFTHQYKWGRKKSRNYNNNIQ